MADHKAHFRIVHSVICAVCYGEPVRFIFISPDRSDAGQFEFICFRILYIIGTGIAF